MHSKSGHVTRATGAPVGKSYPYTEVRETHTGIVVLVGERAYKAKKPLSTDVLDFTTPVLREEACRREVSLNKRLAPESYLGIAHVSDPTGGPAEPLVVMRRYPDSCRLATMATDDVSVEAELEEIARVLAYFHRDAVRGRDVDAQAKAPTLAGRWQVNLYELRRLAGTLIAPELVDQVERLAKQYIGGRSAMFTRRIADRKIVDGHGDLQAEDIFCMPEGPVLLDCLDFDDHLRYVDCIDDAAFLAMDLEFLGRKDLADYFRDCYRESSDDNPPASLIDFYIAYRAIVRAKVDFLRYTQGKPSAAADAKRHVTLAIEHLNAATVRLALVGGGPGTGKTTLACSLAKRAGAAVISTDDVRRELRQANVLSGDAGVLGRGLYSPENVDAVYEEVIRRARELLANGRSVILDATWRSARHRRLAEELAIETQSALLEIACTTSADIAADRVRYRPPGSSDATGQIARALAGGDGEWITAYAIDTTREPSESTNEAEKLWQARSN
jgi:uncharacterized protein